MSTPATAWPTHASSSTFGVRWALATGLVYLGTVLSIAITADLLKGVLFGLMLALGKLLWRIAQLQVTVAEQEEGRIDVSLQGAATFIRLPLLAEALEKLPAGREVHLHVGGLAYIDHACMDVLNDWQHKYAESGIVAVEWDIVWERSQRSLADPSPHHRSDRSAAVAVGAAGVAAVVATFASARAAEEALTTDASTRADLAAATAVLHAGVGVNAAATAHGARTRTNT